MFGHSNVVGTHIVKMGSDKSIILMSKRTGITMEYDLVYDLLDHLPTIPMNTLPNGYEL